MNIKGNNSLSLNASGDFSINTPLDVSGSSVENLSDGTLFVLGGFVRTSNSCCVLGKLLGNVM